MQYARNSFLIIYHLICIYKLLIDCYAYLLQVNQETRVPDENHPPVELESYKYTLSIIKHVFFCVL